MPTWADVFAARAGLLVDGWTAEHDYSADLVASYSAWGTGAGGDIIQFLRPTGLDDVYACEVQSAQESGVSEPDWSTAASVGDTISDGSYLWANCGAVSLFPLIQSWQANRQYSASNPVPGCPPPPNAAVTPVAKNGHVYVSYPNTTGANVWRSASSEPSFPTDGSYVEDPGGSGPGTDNIFWLDMGVVPFTPRLADIMDALADQLRTTLGASIEGIQVEPRFILNPSPDPVTLDLLTGLQEPGAFGIGVQDVMVDIRARINTADHVAAQDVLIGLIDPNGSQSVLQAVMGDPTLGSTVQNCKIEDGPTAMGVFPDASGTAAFLGCTWTVRVIP